LVGASDNQVMRNGYSKQAYFFSPEDWFVTVGPSLPKIARVPNSKRGAQFWVGSIGIISQGGGLFSDARGVATYVGSGYLETWPETFREQVETLVQGFKVEVGTFVKVVLKPDLAADRKRGRG
jgi:hypothetical protein